MKNFEAERISTWEIAERLFARWMTEAGYTTLDESYDSWEEWQERMTAKGLDKGYVEDFFIVKGIEWEEEIDEEN